MAKYIVEDRKTSKYEKNYKMPMINIVPAVVTLGLCVLFVGVYVLLSYLPIIAALPSIAGVIMLTALFWTPADYIGNNIARIVVKVVIAIASGFVELAIFANATVPWLEAREANKPTIRVIDD